MTATRQIVADLLAECDALGIRLLVVGDGGLTIDSPQGALTLHLLERLKAHKADVLTMLRPEPEADSIPLVATKDIPARLVKPICRCGSTTWRDVPIHGGQSIRRDCGSCGRFLEFPVWYGKDTGHIGQHSV